MNDGNEIPAFAFAIANLDFGMSLDHIECESNTSYYKGFSHTAELSASVENMKDVDEILAGDNTFDIVIKDEHGNEYKRERQEILTTLVICKRIPRKMKKSLKKRYGDMWKYHHPNVETEVVIRDKR